MKVSVLITTYNQERFIAQAVDSALMQQTTFDYEIVIGEDCSTDSTRKIILDYRNRHPDKIRLLLPEKNLGLFGKTNFIETLQACRGQYVAMLEGDDYWTSPIKLQKQVEFLDSHPDCSICFHDVTILYEDGSQDPRRFCPETQREVSTIEDLLLGNFIPTCSVIYRRGLFGAFPDWYHTLTIGDWPLHIMNSQHGDIGCINEVMGVYRIHSGGVWSSLNLIQNAQETISFYEKVDKHLKFQYHKLIKSRLSKCYLDLSLEYDKAGERGRARECVLRSIALQPFKKDISSRLLFKIVTRLCAPRLYRNLKSVLYGS